MRNRFVSVLLILILVFMDAACVTAQATTELISIHPMSDEVRGALLGWLEVSKPVPAPYYAVTYIEPLGVDTAVSLVALNIGSADEEWHLTEEDGGESKVIWMGSVIVRANGTIDELFAPVATPESSIGVKVRASMRLAGGGSYVTFPISSGSYAVYGPRGVHGSGDYGTSGMLAVDLVGGDDLSGSMFDTAYASDAGTVDYVCDDGVTVAVRTYNATTGDYFLYAHLLDNANLTLSHEFGKGELLGSLKYGNFDDSCGWAEQQDDHYHIHWMFVPSGGFFQAEGCILDESTQKWTCGTNVIGIGGQLYGGIGSGTGMDDVDTVGSGTNNETGFWDYALIGFVSIFDRGILKLLPTHQSPTAIIGALYNIIRIMLRVVWTLTRFNINLGPLFALVLVAIGFKLLMGAVYLVFAVLRTIKALPGA